MNSFEDVESKTFIVPLSVDRVESSACPQRTSSPGGASASAPRRLRRKPTAARRVSAKKPPEAERRCTWQQWQQPSAASRLRSSCSPKAPRWTPRTTTAGCLNPGRRQTSSLADLGTSEGFSGIETYAFSGIVWQSCEFSAPKNAGSDDHNVICQ